MVGSVAGAGLLALLVWLAMRSGRRMPRALLVLAVAFLGASIVAAGAFAPRYLVLPQMLLWAAVVVASVGWPRRERLMLACLGAVVIAASFPAATANRTAASVRDDCPVPVAPDEDRWDFNCVT